jgi:putative permease
VLATLLFAEVVNLHPVAVVVAILVFGGIWGFWGIFFAIPLATVVQAVLKAWPKLPPEQVHPLQERRWGLRVLLGRPKPQ